MTASMDGRGNPRERADVSSFYYRFDAASTAGSTWFMLGGDEMASLDVAVLPPAGTQVTLPGGHEVRVHGCRLDLSNGSGVAMVYVDVELVAEPAGIAEVSRAPGEGESQ